MDDVATLEKAADAAFEEMEAASTALREAGQDDDLGKLDRAFRAAEVKHRTAVAEFERADRKEALKEARANLPVSPSEPGRYAVDADGVVRGFVPDSGSTTRERGAPHIRVSREPLTYEQRAEDGSVSQLSFFRDMVNAQRGNPGAIERLGRHQQEMVVEKRALSETAGEGSDFTPPVYLTDQWVNLARAGRVTADACTHLELPPSTPSVNLPVLEAGTAVAAQKDLGNVENKDAKTATLTVPVITVAGNQDLSRQLFDRMLPGTDVVIWGDLVAAYNTAIDTEVLNGSGTAPHSRGILQTSAINAVTFTSASPTVAELYGYIADAIQRINSNRFLPPSAIIMHPRRWGWLTAQVDTTGRPLVVPYAGGPQNAEGNLANVAAQGVVGTMLGLQVIVDPSIPTNLGAGTNQDIIIVARVEDLYLWEEQANPVYLKAFEQVLSEKLAVRLQAYGYSAFTAGRYPKAISTVGGTGLVTPVFT